MSSEGDNLMRVRFLIEYDGTDFHGWQVQPGSRTVQGVIEDSMNELCNRRVSLVGSGRTDAGVHALGQVAHADIREEEMERVCSGLPAVLPQDVAILEAREVNEDFHSRFHAVSRLYSYRIEREKHPLRSRYSYTLPQGHSLDTDAMQRAAELSLGSGSWRAMAREGSDNSTWIVDVMEAGVVQDRAGWTFSIRANRFLRGMVRLWTGTLVRIGSGAASPELISQLLSTGDRSSAGSSLPGRGLVLMEVKYS
jgi:tRNA pseudouridine38-40 synthase